MIEGNFQRSRASLKGLQIKSRQSGICFTFVFTLTFSLIQKKIIIHLKIKIR